MFLSTQASVTSSQGAAPLLAAEGLGTSSAMSQGTHSGRSGSSAGALRTPFLGAAATPSTRSASSASRALSSDPLMSYIQSQVALNSSRGSGAIEPLADWQIRFEDISFERPIGEGSWGRVYLAKWKETAVAVKVLLATGEGGNTGSGSDAVSRQAATLLTNSTIAAQLDSEAQLMARMRHPNIVQLLGVCQFPAAVVLEYCSRGSLYSVLQAAAASPALAAELPWSRRLALAADAVRGMIYLHTHSPPIVHRDLKSPNLLVSASWTVKVSDFNLSKILEHTTRSSSLRAMNPRWLAPEVLQGQPATLAVDVYAFGVVLWELLTWQVPWGAANPWAVVSAINAGGRPPIPSPQDLPGPQSGEWPQLERYVELMQRCWAQAPEERPTFDEVIAELRALDPVAVM